MKKRVLSLLLCLVMALSLIPTVAFAGSGSIAITKVEVTGMQTLTPGQQCSTDNITITTTPANAYTVDRIWWYDVTARNYPMSENTFNAGHVYSLGVKLSPKDGYYFAYAGSNEDYTGVATINGETPLKAKAYDPGSSELWLQSTDMTVTVAPIPITKVEVKGVQTPVVGQSTDTSGIIITSTPANAFTVDYICWFNPSDWTSNDTTFKAGKEYRLDLRLAPKEGYNFPFDPFNYTGVVTVNGTEVEAYSSNYTEKISISSDTFMAVDSTAATPITKVDIIGIKTPVVGRPVRDFMSFYPEDSICCIYDAKWFCDTDVTFLDADYVFEEGKEYSLKVYVTTSDDNYCVNLDTVLRFNHGEIDTYDAYSLDVNCLEGWTETMLPLKTIDTVNITGVKMPVAGGKVGDFLNLTPADSTYVISGIFWNCVTDVGVLHANDVFEAGKEYYLGVTVAPADGYVMSEDARFLFNGGAIATDNYYTCVNYDGTLSGFTVDLPVTNGPAAPTVPTAKGDYLTSTGKPYIKWDAVTGAVEYEVYRSGSSTGTYKLLGTTDKCNYTDTTAGTGYIYYYKVVAVGAGGSKSGYSAYVAGTCHCAAPVVKPDYLTSTGKPYLKWNAVEGAVKYEVYRSGSSTGTYKLLGTTDKLNYTDTTAGAGYAYYYKVKAVSKVSTKANSYYSAYVAGVCHCAAPVAKADYLTSTGKPYIKWDAVSGASKYEVYRCGTSNGTYTLLGTTDKLNYTDTKANAGYAYYYKVKAVSKVSTKANSYYSAYVVGTCHCAAPVVSITTSNGHPSLSWAAVAGANKYEVYRSTDGKNYTKYSDVTNTSYVNSSATAGTTYYYKVKAVSSVSTKANSYYSNVVSIKAK